MKLPQLYVCPKAHPQQVALLTPVSPFSSKKLQGMIRRG